MDTSTATCTPLPPPKAKAASQRKQFVIPSTDRPYPLPHEPRHIGNPVPITSHPLGIFSGTLYCTRCAQSCPPASPPEQQLGVDTGTAASISQPLPQAKAASQHKQFVIPYTDRPYPLPREPIHIGNQVTHHTHPLGIFRGMLYCTRRGCRGGSNQLHYLAKKCEPPSSRRSDTTILDVCLRHIHVRTDSS